MNTNPNDHCQMDMNGLACLFISLQNRIWHSPNLAKFFMRQTNNSFHFYGQFWPIIFAFKNIFIFFLSPNLFNLSILIILVHHSSFIIILNLNSFLVFSSSNSNPMNFSNHSPVQIHNHIQFHSRFIFLISLLAQNENAAFFSILILQQIIFKHQPPRPPACLYLCVWWILAMGTYFEMKKKILLFKCLNAFYRAGIYSLMMNFGWWCWCDGDENGKTGIPNTN